MSAPRAAVGSFPYLNHRTVAEVDHDERVKRRQAAIAGARYRRLGSAA